MAIWRHQATPPVYPGRTADYSSKDQHSMLCMAVSQAAWGGSNYPKARGNHQALVVSPSSLVWESMSVMLTRHDDIDYLIYTTAKPWHITILLCARALVMMRLVMIRWWQLCHTFMLTNSSRDVTSRAVFCYNTVTAVHNHMTNRCPLLSMVQNCHTNEVQGARLVKVYSSDNACGTQSDKPCWTQSDKLCGTSCLNFRIQCSLQILCLRLKDCVFKYAWSAMFRIYWASLILTKPKKSWVPAKLANKFMGLDIDNNQSLPEYPTWDPGSANTFV